jgi:hypothetical protein
MALVTGCCQTRDRLLMQSVRIPGILLQHTKKYSARFHTTVNSAHNQFLFPCWDKKAPPSPFSTLAFSTTSRHILTDSAGVIGPLKSGAYFANLTGSSLPSGAINQVSKNNISLVSATYAQRPRQRGQEQETRTRSPLSVHIVPRTWPSQHSAPPY